MVQKTRKKALRNKFLETNDKWYVKNRNPGDLKNDFKIRSLGELTSIVYMEYSKRICTKYGNCNWRFPENFRNYMQGIFLEVKRFPCYSVMFAHLHFADKVLIASVFYIFSQFKLIICFSVTNLQKQPLEVCYKKVILKYFAKFSKKHLCRSLFFNKVAGLGLGKKSKKSV